MTLTLGELKTGDRGRVIGFGQSEKGYRTKLLTMGFVKGTEFTVARMAPLGDPVELEIRGYNLSLRKDEASAVLVEKIT
jgi:ferrous iron transport protein A